MASSGRRICLCHIVVKWTCEFCLVSG